MESPEREHMLARTAVANTTRARFPSARRPRGLVCYVVTTHVEEIAMPKVPAEQLHTRSGQRSVGIGPSTGAAEFTHKRLKRSIADVGAES